MGSKRKPFITSKAVSEALIKSGRDNNWTASEVIEIGELAGVHFSEHLVDAAFEQTAHISHLTAPMGVFVAINRGLSGFRTVII